MIFDFITESFTLLIGIKWPIAKIFSSFKFSSSEGHIFVLHNSYFIGHVYKKAVFREYTDKTFKVKKPGKFDILGPAMKAEVGDVIKITFYNKASRRYSIHSHGVMTRYGTNLVFVT